MAEVGQDHPVTEPAAVEGQPSPPAEASSQIGVPQTHIRRVALNVSLSLLIAIGITLLNNLSTSNTLSTSVKALFSAGSVCFVLVTWFFSLYDKDLKKDFKKEARDFLESRSCTWSLALPVVVLWTVNAYLGGFWGRTESLIKGEPVVLQVVPAKSVFQILDGAGINSDPIVLRLHYRGGSKDYKLKSAGVIYLGSSVSDLQAQEKQLRESLQNNLKEYLFKEGVPKENHDPFLTVWGSDPQYLGTPVFRAGEKVGIDLVCADGHTVMAQIPAFHLARNQSPVYLECPKEHNPCAPPI